MFAQPTQANRPAVRRASGDPCGERRGAGRRAHPERRPSRHRAGVLLTGLFLLLGAGLAGDRPAQAQEAWEYSPYRIQVWMAFESTPELTEDLARRMTRTLLQRSEAEVGGAWRLRVDPAPPRLRHDVSQAPARLSFYELIGMPEPAPEAEESTRSSASQMKDGEGGLTEEAKQILQNDKLYLLGVRQELDHYVIRIREFDSATRQWGRFVQQPVWQPEMLCEAAFDSLMRAFTPMVRIEDAEEKSAVTRLRAGNLVPHPDSIVNVHVGDVLAPVVRRNNRYGEPMFNGIEVIPWTFLMVTQREDSILNCQIHSGLRRAVSGRSSVRIQRYGMLVRPQAESTELLLTSRDVPPITLVGYEVYSKYPAEEAAEAEAARQAAERARAAEEQGETPETETPETGSPDASETAPAEGTGSDSGPPASPATDQNPDGPPAESDDTGTPPQPKENPPVLLGRSDWRGIVVVPRGESPIRLVYVKSGGRLLARLPIVPGLEERLVVELMNDDLRLQAEAFIAGVRSKIMDLVARRAVLSARIRNRINENKVAEAEELMAEFRSLESRRDVAGLLDQEQQRFVTTDRVSQRKIDILFSDTRELLAKFLTDEAVGQLAQEIRQKQGTGS